MSAKRIFYFYLVVLLFPAIFAYCQPLEIGAETVQATPLSKGTLFAANGGKGEKCSQKYPCNIQTAISQLKPGSILFLKGGKYHLQKSLTIPVSGTKEKPIMIESYPHEWAVLSADTTKAKIKTNKNLVRDGIFLAGREYISIKRLEITKMAARGINILYSSHIKVEGCHIHHNFLSGITIYGGNYNKPYHPYKYGYNLLQHNIIHHNSDAGLYLKQKDQGHIYSYNNGDNADGISVSSGKFNIINHNTVYTNADDGIDLWRSNDSTVTYNMVNDNGRGFKGNGNGIKAGGNLDPHATNGQRAIIEHNIAYHNRRQGFDINSGKNVIYRYNTAYQNGSYGFSSAQDTVVTYNIAAKNGKKTVIYKGHSNNSWQYTQNPEFLSIQPASTDFLKIKPNSQFSTMGAYAHEIPSSSKYAKIFIIGDSTVYNMSHGELGWGSKLSEYAKYPHNIFNLARSGASSHTFLNISKTHHDWPHTKQLIQKTNIDSGAYLFIQFGHNNKDKNYTKFYQDLKYYIKEAHTLGVIPVLITPVERFYKHVKSHGKLPDIIRLVAKENHTILLDLQEKSWNAFNRYPSHDKIFHRFGYDDHTHFSPKGAAIVAGWVKALACQNDQNLCQQFK